MTWHQCISRHAMYVMRQMYVKTSNHQWLSRHNCTSWHQCMSKYNLCHNMTPLYAKTQMYVKSKMLKNLKRSVHTNVFDNSPLLNHRWFHKTKPANSSPRHTLLSTTPPEGATFGSEHRQRICHPFNVLTRAVCELGLGRCVKDGEDGVFVFSIAIDQRVRHVVRR